MDDKLILSSLEDDPSFEFYLEDINTNEFIEQQAVYTEDGKYVTKVIDSLGKETTYNINEEKGLIDSIINSKGIETKYTYDQDRLTSVELDNKKVEYTYENNLIKNIKTGNKNYKIEYDDYDRLIQLADNMNNLGENCTFEQRCLSLSERYHVPYEKFSDEINLLNNNKKYFDKLCGCNVYKLFGLKK